MYSQGLSPRKIWEQRSIEVSSTSWILVALISVSLCILKTSSPQYPVLYIYLFSISGKPLSLGNYAKRRAERRKRREKRTVCLSRSVKGHLIGIALTLNFNWGRTYIFTLQNLPAHEYGVNSFIYFKPF